MRRSGFTLIEVLIAVILIDIGLLALVATGSVLVRRTTEYRLRRSALRVAGDRLALLGASPCVGAAGVATDTNGIVERWRAGAPINDARELSDSVTFAVANVEKAIVLRTVQPC